ncbi:hypothetical protein BCR32DRAFT_279153 [Anaeromyces robustus]|uniref:Uncharacterized protein n=1 Tax=Anaeromyces robustus TaxID=1754192 RepID=A0A1Y1X9P2_9FUNG|nr:hypothetical protein BCR32DRAFT_279153 [Anaeromyces robustus]|eukprot:ORX82136.1 hypothetical protein BCR32DRAFT_279153 [Anaeromyces robustus]
MSSFLFSYFDFLQKNIKNPNLYSISKNELKLPFQNIKDLLSFFSLFIYPENKECIYYEISKCNEEGEIKVLLKEFQQQELSQNTINNLYSYIFSYNKEIIEALNSTEYDKILQLFCYKNLYIQKPLKIDLIIKCYKTKLNPSIALQYNGTISTILKTLIKIKSPYLNFISIHY